MRVGGVVGCQLKGFAHGVILVPELFVMGYSRVDSGLRGFSPLCCFIRPHSTRTTTLFLNRRKSDLVRGGVVMLSTEKCLSRAVMVPNLVK
jgi:hypothetical protein